MSNVVLTDASRRALERGTIRPHSRITVFRRHKGMEVATILDNVESYTLSHDRKFGASQCSLTCTNPNGVYTHTNESIHSKNMILDAAPSAISYPDTYSFSDYDSIFNVTASTDLELDFSSGLYSYSGYWISEVIDGGADHVRWTEIRATGSTPTRSSRLALDGTYIIVYARFGSDADTEHESWTDWGSTVTLSSSSQETRRNKTLTSEMRYMQLRVELVSDDGSVTPTLSNLTIEHKAGIAKRLPSPLIYWGNRILLEEGIYSQEDGRIQWFNKFYGIISGISPNKQGAFANIQVECYDFMKLLLQDIIEKPKYSREEQGDSAFEPDRFGPEIITLQRLEVGSALVEVLPTEVGFIYSVPEEYRENPTVTNINPDGTLKADGDRKYLNWARYPAPTISIDDKAIQSEYEIDYANGVTYFKYQKNEGQTVKAEFYWYDMDTNRFEDVLFEILKDGYASGGYEETWALDNPDGTLEMEYDPTYFDNDDEDANDKRIEWVSSPSGFRISLDMSFPRATVPRTFFRVQDNKTHFQAIQEILTYVDPTYRVFADSNGNFLGRYQPQKPQEDFALTLTKSIETPISTENLYTRVVAFGQMPSGTNVAPQASIQSWNSGWASSSANGIYASSNRDAPDPSVIIDSNIDSNIGFWSHDEPSPPQTMFTVKLKAPLRVGRVDLLIGNGPEARAITNIGVRIQVSADGSTWYDLSDNKSKVVGSTSEWMTITEEDISDAVKMMKVGYAKLIATDFGEYRTVIYGTDYAWAVKEFRIWSSTEIRAEASVDNIIQDPPGVGFISSALAAKLNERIGQKTLVLATSPSLDTEAKVLARAKDTLYEICRMLHKGKVEVIYSPHLEVGMTVRLYDPDLGIDTGSGNPGRLFYVESISHTKTGFEPSVSLELISWD